MRKLVMAGFAVALASCQAGQDTDAAEREVVAFHEAYDAERFEPLFDRSAPVLKQMTPRAQFLAFLAETRRRLGPVKSTSRTGWRVNYDTGGSEVELTYRTTFANGEATETFVYDTGEPPRLLGYHIKAPVVAAP
jgi:hypothetical protein